MTDIVWAEDSATDQFLIQSALQDAGPLDVAFAVDGADALRLVEDLRPRLVVLDLKMPRVGGLEALRRLRQTGPGRQTRVVLFSSSSQPSEMQAGAELGAAAFVQKPIDYDGFQAAVALVLSHLPAARPGSHELLVDPSPGFAD